VIVSNFIGSYTSLVATVNVPRVFVLSGSPVTTAETFRFQLSGDASKPAQLQATTNFTQWSRC
jgi:hypothetical protein